MGRVTVVESTYAQVKRFIKAAEGQYYRLVLLVGMAGTGKTGFLQKLAEEFGSYVVNVNLELSGSLLELTEKQRALHLSEQFGRLVDQSSEAPVLLDNLEVLFDKSLKQDPLRLLQIVSRNKIVVAAWNGSVVNDQLIYAEPDHFEYRGFVVADTLIVDVNGLSAANSA